MSDDLSRDLIAALRKGRLSVPVQDSAVFPIEGPGVLPYLPVFQHPEGVHLVFGEIETIELDGADCLHAALDGGWGVVLDLQTALPHGSLYGLAARFAGRSPALHAPFDLSVARALRLVVPDQDRVPQGLRRAMHHVLETHKRVSRAWLVLACEDPTQDDAQDDAQPADPDVAPPAGAAAPSAPDDAATDDDAAPDPHDDDADADARSNLVLVVETPSIAALAGAELMGMLDWAAPPGDPIQLMVSHDGSLFAADRMDEAAVVFP